MGEERAKFADPNCALHAQLLQFKFSAFVRCSEEGEGGVEDAAETVIDIINAFHLSETSLTKKDFTTYIKGYLKRVVDYLQEHNPSRVEAFKTESAALVKKILGSFDDFQFFMSESNDFEASLVYAYYKDEETAPRFIYLKDGLKEEKY